VGLVEPITVSAPRRYFDDINSMVDAPHLDMMKRGWPTY
jgi:hypothetical protein